MAWLIDAQMEKQAFIKLRSIKKMRKEKENAVKVFREMIEQSRTWERLTDNEKNQFLDFLNNSQMANDTIKGTYEHRQMILCALYYAFLAGCGYQGGFTFRE